MKILFLSLLRRGYWHHRCGGYRNLFSRSNYTHNQKPPFNILFFGTDEFALETLRTLVKSQHAIVNSDKLVNTLHVVSTSAATPVAAFAEKEKLTLISWPPDLRALERYDMGVLVSFGHLVPGKVIAKFPHGIINMHPSLLPRWRGAAPIVHTVLSGDRDTGISVISIQPKRFDTGPLLRQAVVPIPPRSSARYLASLLASRGADLLMEVLAECPDIITNSQPQPNTGVTYAHKIDSSMSMVNWEAHSSCQVERQYRALSHMMPLRTFWKGQPVKLLNMIIDVSQMFEPAINEKHCTLDGSPGSVVFDHHLRAICVKCKTGWTCFRSITWKKTMTASDFYNGYLSKNKKKGVHFESAHNRLFGPEYLEFISRPKAKS